MKNYYFNSYFGKLEENVINSCGEIDYIVVNDVEDFKAFCDEMDMIDEEVASTGIYYFDSDYGEWRELDQYAYPIDYNRLVKYLNKTKDNTKEDNIKENDTMNNREKTFNYLIEFKNGFISEEKCDKSFNKIFNSVKDLYNSVIFGNNIKKITIEMN